MEINKLFLLFLLFIFTIYVMFPCYDNWSYKRDVRNLAASDWASA